MLGKHSASLTPLITPQVLPAPGWPSRTQGTPRRPSHRVGRRPRARLPGERVLPSFPKLATPREEQGRPRPPVSVATSRVPCPGATGCPGLGRRGAVEEKKKGRTKAGEQEETGEKEEPAPPLSGTPAKAATSQGG